MKSILISTATLATASAIAQTLPPPSPIWTKTSTDADVTIDESPEWIWDRQFYINNTPNSIVWNYDGTTVFFNCHWKVTGSTANAPWIIQFSMLADNSWVEEFSGTYTVLANSYAIPRIQKDKRQGFESWHNNPENYDARRDIDAYFVDGIIEWRSVSNE